MKTVRIKRALARFATLLALCSCGNAYGAQTTVIAEGFNHPWALAFLPDGSYLVTEKVGALRRVSADGRISEPLAGVPPVYFAGQGGLMDVRLHPRFEDNGWVYLSFAHGTPEANATRVVRGTLGATSLNDVTEVFTAVPSKDTPVHYGGRLAFLPDETLLITTGDGFNYREAAQDLSSLLGKTIRVTDTGEIPADNPFVGESGANPKIFSYGHRNAQGLVVNPQDGAIYLHEHGPKGGDEINEVRAGQNYGWPAATYGMDYTGAHVSPFTSLAGVAEPLKTWVPSIAPSGLDIYQGDLVVGALVDAEVRQVAVADGSETVLFADLNERVREVRVGSDQCLYVLTDGEGGRLLRSCSG